MNPISILIVEDDDGDVEIMKEAFPDDLEYSFHRARNGEEALSCISRTPPDIVFLDLNMPRTDGRDVLREMKIVQRQIPIIIVSTSTSAEDIKLSYELGANAYVSKSASFTDFADKMDGLSRFWFKHALLPPKSS